jgi:hypothetical protein
MKNISKKISEEINSRLNEKLYETNTTKINWCKKLLMLELGLASAIKYKLSDLLIENTKL